MSKEVCSQCCHPGEMGSFLKIHGINFFFCEECLYQAFIKAIKREQYGQC